MTRLCLLLDLVDDADLIAEYRRRLAMIMETAPGFDAAAKAMHDAANPEVQAWEVLMDRFQRRLACATAVEKWVAANRIYALSEQS